MVTGVSDLLMYVPLLGALVWAAAEDVISRRIRNVLACSLIVAGFTQSFLPFHTVTPLTALWGFLAAIGVVFVHFALGGMHGGDLKLMAAVGTWIGPMPVVNVFLVAAIFGMVVVLAQATATGKLRALVRNSAVMAVNIAHVNELGIDHVAEVGTKTSIDKPLPYAISILAGVVMVLCGIGFDFSGVL